MKQKPFQGVAMVACLMAGLILTGCRGALGIHNTQQTKINAVKQSIAENREKQVKEAAKHVYAVSMALETETNRTPAINIASDFAQLAQVTLGSPERNEMAVLREMIQGLMSTNAAIQAEAEKQKQQMAAAVESLQGAQKKLEGKLGQAERKRDEAYATAAQKAAIYEKWRSRLRWTVGLVAGGFLLSILLPALSTVFPVLTPFATVVNGMFGAFSKMLFRAAPQAMQTAGVVGQTAHTLSENTLRDLVIAIGNIKTKNPDVFDTVLKPELQNATAADASRVKIDEIKGRLKRLTPTVT